MIGNKCEISPSIVQRLCLFILIYYTLQAEYEIARLLKSQQVSYSSTFPNMSSSVINM